MIGGDDEEAEEPSLEEKEIEAMKLLFNQGRLAERGATEMVLTQITACKGQAGDMMENTLTLGRKDLQNLFLETLWQFVKSESNVKWIG